MELDIMDSRETVVSYLRTGIQVLRPHRDMAGGRVRRKRADSAKGIFQVFSLGASF